MTTYFPRGFKKYTFKIDDDEGRSVEGTCHSFSLTTSPNPQSQREVDSLNRQGGNFIPNRDFFINLEGLLIDGVGSLKLTVPAGEEAVFA